MQFKCNSKYFSKGGLSAIGGLLLVWLCLAAGTREIQIYNFDTVAQLLASGSPSANRVVYVAGYWAPNDGGGGTFISTNTSSATNRGSRLFSGESGKSWDRVDFGQAVNVKWFGAKGGTNDDQLAIQEAINYAAGTGLQSGLGRKLELPQFSSFTVSGTLWFTNRPVNFNGNGSSIYGASDVRLITVSNVFGNRIENLVLKGITNGTTQAGIRYEKTTNCFDANVSSEYMGLNGFEITHSEQNHGTSRRSIRAKAFGMFYYMTTDSDDWYYFIQAPGSFAREYKNSKRSHGRQGWIDNPLGEMAIYFWTGTGTMPEVPGDMLTEDCGEHDLYVTGGPNTKQMAYVNAGRRCFIRGAYLLPDIDAGWGIVDINGMFFYNEGLPMAGDMTTGSTNILNVTHADQLKQWDRIHIADSLTNNTVYAVSGSTVRLYTPVDLTAAGRAIGFLAKPDDTDLQDITILGWGDDAGTMINSIQIGGTAGDPLEGISLKNVKIESSGNYSMNVQYATVRVEGGSSRHAAGLREWNLDTGAKVAGSKVIFSGRTNFPGYGVYLQNGASVSLTDCDFDGFGIAAVSPHLPGDRVYMTRGFVRNILTQPVGLISDSSVLGTVFEGNLWDLGSFNGEIRVYGTNNNVIGATMDPKGSVYVSEHIHEEVGATANFYGPNNYMGNLINNVTRAVGSTSSSIGPKGLMTTNIVANVPNVINVAAVPAPAAGDSNGSAGTDDTVAIQGKLNQGGTNSIVYLPKGRYKITPPLKFYSGQTIRGQFASGVGRVGEVEILATGTSTNSLFEPIDMGYDNMGVHLENLQIRGNGFSKAGVNFYRVSRGSLENVYVTGCETGVIVDGAGGPGAYYNTFWNAESSYNTSVNWMFRNVANDNMGFNCRSIGAPTGMVFTASSTGNGLFNYTAQGVGAPNATDTHILADAGGNYLFGGFIELSRVGIQETVNGSFGVLAVTWGSGVTNRFIENPNAKEGLRLMRVPVPGDVGFEAAFGGVHYTNNTTSDNASAFWTIQPRSQTNVVQYIFGYGGPTGGTNRFLWASGTNTQSYVDMNTGNYVFNQTTGAVLWPDVRMRESGVGEVQVADASNADANFKVKKITASDNLVIATAGKGLQVKEGSNAKMGTATLSGGGATVATTAVTASSRIFLTNQSAGGTPGFLRVGTVTAGTSFTITSSSGSDTSTVAWFIVEPAP